MCVLSSKYWKNLEAKKIVPNAKLEGIRVQVILECVFWRLEATASIDACDEAMLVWKTHPSAASSQLCSLSDWIKCDLHRMNDRFSRHQPDISQQTRWGYLAQNGEAITTTSEQPTASCYEHIHRWKRAARTFITDASLIVTRHISSHQFAKHRHFTHLHFMIECMLCLAT